MSYMDIPNTELQKRVKGNLFLDGFVSKWLGRIAATSVSFNANTFNR